MNGRRRDFFRPLVESLEPRRLLACEVLFLNGTLTVLGDRSDNTIELFVAKDGIHVTCDGERSGPSPAPLLGQHNEDIYCNELRLDKRDVEALGASGII